VAQWREAQDAALEDSDEHTLSQFRAATQVLAMATIEGLPEDACPFDPR
jgi:hypothetical protein